MTLERKASQVLLVAFDGTTLTGFTRRSIEANPPAGVLLLSRNVVDAGQVRLLTASLQSVVAAIGSPALFVAADEEGGGVMRIRDGVPDLPAARLLGDTSTPERARELAQETAAGLMDQGVNMMLAPVADVVADEDSFLFQRSYGDTAATVSAFVAAVCEGAAAAGVITVVKHFPGHGSAPGNSHTTVPVAAATRAEFEGIHLPPFRAALEAGTEGVMVGHFMVPAYDDAHPASQSPPIIESLLRGALGFGGLVVSDDLEMSAAAGRSGAVGASNPATVGLSAVSALDAGCDLLITTGTFDRQLAVRQAIVEAVRDGSLSEDRLDDAVARVLAFKAAHRLPLAPAL